MFDNVCKYLVETFPRDFAQWLLGEPIPLTELSPSELSQEPIRADSVMLLQATGLVLHLEFQTQPDPTMSFRMLDYWVRMRRRFPDRTLPQVVIYLRTSGSPLVQETVFAQGQTRHGFQVIRLWEIPSESLLLVPGLLPLAILGQTGDREDLLSQVASQIEAIPAPRTRNNVAASTAVLAGLVLEKDLIRRVLRYELMRESVIYQDILAEGLERGRQEGRVEGRQEGRVEGERLLVLRLLNRRLGALSDDVQTQINQLTLLQLEALGEALLDFTAPEDLNGWLRSRSDA